MNRRDFLVFGVATLSSPLVIAEATLYPDIREEESIDWKVITGETFPIGSLPLHECGPITLAPYTVYRDCTFYTNVGFTIPEHCHVYNSKFFGPGVGSDRLRIALNLTPALLYPY